MQDSTSDKRLSTIVFDHIVNSILSGSIEPNARVVERKIASQLGISHVPVREAFEKLEHDGWIERLPQRGARVKEFNEKEIEDLFQVRKILECGAVSSITFPLSHDQLRMLEEPLEALVMAHGAANIEEAMRADSLFHRAIVQCTGNDKLIGYHKTVVLQLQTAFPVFLFGALDLAFGQKLKYEGLQLESHKEIYHALLSGETAVALDLVDRHISRSSEGIKILHNIQHGLKVSNLV